MKGQDGVPDGATVTRGFNDSETAVAAAAVAARAAVIRAALTAGLIAGTTGAVLAQRQPAPTQTPATPAPEATSPTQPPSPTAALPAPAPEKRGFFDELSRRWNDSIADFNAKWKEQQTKLDDFNKKSAEAAKDAAAATQQAMKNAADAMVKSATSKVIETSEPCAIAGNGAADCASAAVNACKAKGFADGQPLDVRTAEKCNASLWLQGQRQTPVACPIETVVLRAACQ